MFLETAEGIILLGVLWPHLQLLDVFKGSEMLRITNVKVDVKHDLNDVIETIKELLNITDVSDVRINNKSIDARNKNNIMYIL